MVALDLILQLFERGFDRENLSLGLFKLLLEADFELVCLLADTLLKIVVLPLSNTCDLIHAALPAVVITLFIKRPDHDHVDILLLVLGGNGHERGKIAENLQSGALRVDIFLLDCVAERVAHDGDQHVEHNNLRVRDSDEEDHEDKLSLSALLIVVLVFWIAEGHEVLIVNGINEPETEGIINQSRSIFSVKTEHAH